MTKLYKALFVFLVLNILFMYGATVGAVPAAGLQLQYSQPSGETFTAAVYGDEKNNWVVAETGEVIVLDNDKYWKFAEEVKGKIKASKHKYSKSGQKPLKIIKNKDVIIQIKKANEASKASTKTSDVSTINPTNSTSSTNSAVLLNSSTASSQKILTLLVQFSDVKIKYSETTWSNQFYGTTGSTVNNYYKEVSNGTFSFTPGEETSGTVNDGIIRVTLNYAHPNTGGNIGYVNQKIVSDALTAANPYINYASFDTNGDGVISTSELHIVTIVAGYEAAYGGASPSIWAHRWSTSVNLDGKYLSSYTQQGEVHYDHMATIGTLTHELGHDLGLPDLYDYDGSSLGVGIHSLMAGGSWAYNGGYPGSSPTHLDAWSKIKLGYVTPNTVTATGDYTVKSLDTTQYNVLKVPTSNPSEYFLVENRQNVGFDKGLSGSEKTWGIAIWHIDESILNSNYWRPNDNETRKGVDLEEANQGTLGYSQLDKRYYSNYYHYYSSGNVATFSSASVPNSNLYNGTKTNISMVSNVPSSNAMLININLGSVEVPPVISNAAVDVNPFAPTGLNNATISYTLSKDAYTTIAIYDSKNALVKTLESSVLKTKGNNSGTWDGKNSSGNIVGDGVYTYKITAVDKVGLNATPVNGNISVEKDVPVIWNVIDSPDPFTAATNTVSTIGYTISEAANVNIKIFDNNNNLVKTLFADIVSTRTNTVTWNGKNDSNLPCQNGVYTYKINATDNYNKVAVEVTGTITIDRGAPVTLKLYGQKPDVFKLNSKITYGIDQNAYVRLNIYDSNGTLVRSLLNNVKRNAGTYYTAWSGKNNTNKNLLNGTYTYRIEAEDLNGNISGPFSGSFTIDREGPIITDLAVSDNPYAPNGDNESTISYNLSESGKVTVNIYNSNNILQKTLINKVEKGAGINSVLWDGKDKYGDFVADGTYVVRVSAYDGFGNRSATISITILVDSTAPSIDNVSDSPDPLRLGDGLQSTISFSVSENGVADVNIFDVNGNLVRYLFDSQVTKGTKSIKWDGKDNSGLLVENGTYIYKINATDLSGKKAVEQIGTITTDKTPVVISNVSTNPQVFAPSGAILYTISKDAKVTVKILNSSNQEIKTIESSVQKPKGSYSATWDGKNTNGAYAVSGTYKYIITAVDGIGFNAIPAEGSIVFTAPDIDAPQITNVTDSPDSLKLGAVGAKNTINFTLSENATLTLKIYDSDNTLIKTLVNTSVTAGSKAYDWDGKDSSGKLVEDGIYIYKISAKDSSANSSGEIVGTITTDKTPVVITNVTVKPTKFSISGNINYTLSENAKVTIEIYDDKNNLINVIANTVSMNAGLQTTAWNGKDSNNFDVQSGNYTYVITAIDVVGFISSVQGTVTVEGPAPVISNLSSTPEPFIPTGSNSVALSYTITSNANATLKIFDSNNNLVKTILSNNVVVRGENTSYWNGRNESGSLVSDGIYSYKISAVDVLGKASNEAVGSITVDNTVPTITNVSAAPNPLGTGSIATISYTLSENAKVGVKIYDNLNNLVRTIEDGISKVAGANSAKWNGKDSNGNSLIGNYSYTITAIDIANFTASASGIITCVDNTKPVISNVGDSPDPLKLDGTSTAIISYTLSKDAKVSINVYDNSGNLVKSLVDNMQQSKGTNSTWWNGKNESGSLIAEGVYTYKINAVDGLGNSAVEASGTITTVKIASGTSLTINSHSISNNPFVTTEISEVTISYNISKSADVTVKIYNSSNVVAKTLSSGSVNSGNNSVKWDGKSAFGNVVQDGVYTYTIEAVDATGQKVSASGIFVVSTPVVNFNLVISDVTTSANPFKPNNVDLWNVNFTLSGDANVYLQIENSTGGVVWTARPVSFVKGQRTIQLYGTNDWGQLLDDGNYTYRVWAVDAWGTKSNEVIGFWVIDKTAPIISLNSSSYNFETNVEIAYNLSENAKVTTIISNGTTTIRTLESNMSKSNGTNSVTWDGKDSNGNLVANGTYTFAISATDGVGLKASKSVTLIKDVGAPVISNVSEDTDPFKPSGSNYTIITYTISKNAYVSIIAYDSNGNKVKTVLNNYPATKGVNSAKWDGTDDSNTIVVDGTYIYRINAVDTLGNSAVQVGGTIIIDRVAPVISNFKANPYPFVPDGTAKMTISYDLSENSNVSIGILDDANNVLTALESNNLKVKGQNITTWDGLVSGLIIEDGIYRVRITATDGVNNSWEYYDYIGIDRFTPQIIGVDDTPDPFNPSIVDFSTIHGEFSEWFSNANASIYSSTNSKVKEFDMQDIIEFWWGWSGTDSQGNKVTDGVYTYKVNGTDLFGKSAKEASGTITIDTSVPEISGLSFVPELENPRGTIKYSLSEDAFVSIAIYDAANKLINELESNILRNTGSNSVYWDGTGNGKLVGYGVYTYKITAVGSNGAKAIPLVGTITFETIDSDYIDNTIDDNIGEDTSASSSQTTANGLIISGVSDSPDVIRPNAGDVSTINFTISKEALVTINIYDNNNKLIKTVVNKRFEDGKNNVKWNGKNSTGSIVNDGIYTFQITGVDSLGNYAKPVSGTINVGTYINNSNSSGSSTTSSNNVSMVTISNVTLSPTKFAPSGTITYTLSKEAKVTLTIYDRALNVVRTLESGVAKRAGRYSVTWDGKNSKGYEVDDVIYTYKINAVATNEVNATPVSGTISMDIKPFTISVISVSPNPYNPRGSVGGVNPATITYNSSVDAKISASIYDSNGKVIKILCIDESVVAGNNILTWHGTDSNGMMISTGTYTCKITGVNNAGKQRELSVNILVQ